MEIRKNVGKIAVGLATVTAFAAADLAVRPTNAQTPIDLSSRLTEFTNAYVLPPDDNPSPIDRWCTIEQADFADIDGDGDFDWTVVCGFGDNTARIYENEGGLLWEMFRGSDQYWRHDVRWFDADADGKLDILNYQDTIIWNNATNGFAEENLLTPRGLTPGFTMDVMGAISLKNGSLIPLTYAGNRKTVPDHITALKISKDRSIDVITYPGDAVMAFLTGDPDGDGKPDLVGFEDEYSLKIDNPFKLSVFKVSEDGIASRSDFLYPDVPGPREGLGDWNLYEDYRKIGDINGDGKDDFLTFNIVSNIIDNSKDGDTSVVIVNGGDTFTPGELKKVGKVPKGIGVADFNCDGRNDVLVYGIDFENDFPNVPQSMDEGILFQGEDGKLGEMIIQKKEEVSGYYGGLRGRAAGVADMNNDGYPDFWTGGYNKIRVRYQKSCSGESIEVTSTSTTNATNTPEPSASSTSTSVPSATQIPTRETYEYTAALPAVYVRHRN